MRPRSSHFVLTMALLLMPGLALAQAPQLMPLQGYLTDDAGEPVDGDVEMIFAIYDMAEGGETRNGRSSTRARCSKSSSRGSPPTSNA